MLGGLVLTDAKLSLGAMTALAALVGLVYGYFNGTGICLSAQSVVAARGLAPAVFVLVLLAAALVATQRADWARIAVRVGGS